MNLKTFSIVGRIVREFDIERSIIVKQAKIKHTFIEIVIIVEAINKYEHERRNPLFAMEGESFVEILRYRKMRFIVNKTTIEC